MNHWSQSSSHTPQAFHLPYILTTTPASLFWCTNTKWQSPVPQNLLCWDGLLASIARGILKFGKTLRATTMFIFLFFILLPRDLFSNPLHGIFGWAWELPIRFWCAGCLPAGMCSCHLDAHRCRMVRSSSHPFLFFPVNSRMSDGHMATWEVQGHSYSYNYSWFAVPL